MAIIKILKEDEQLVLPVTVTEAIIDKNNIKLDTKIQDIEAVLQRHSENNELISIDITDIKAKNVVLEDSLLSYKATVNNSITLIYLDISSNKEDLLTQITEITKKPILSGVITPGNDVRGDSLCVILVKDPGKCTTSLDTNNIYIITKDGEMYINDTTVTIDLVSLLVYAYDLWEVIPLNIPIIPMPKEEDAGKYLKVAENKTIYWG